MYILKLLLFKFSQIGLLVVKNSQDGDFSLIFGVDSESGHDEKTGAPVSKMCVVSILTKQLPKQG